MSALTPHENGSYSYLANCDVGHELSSKDTGQKEVFARANQAILTRYFGVGRTDEMLDRKYLALPKSKKTARQSDLFRFSSELVRVEGIEPSSHAWEAYIIAVIRYPR